MSPEATQAEQALLAAASAAAAATPEGAPRIDVAPSETATYEPLGITVKKVRRSDGEVAYEASYLISPFKVVVIRLGEDGKRALIDGYTGGIALA